MATRTGAGRKAGSNAGTRTGTEPTLTATLLEASIANSGRAAPARRVTAGSRRTARPRSTGEVARAARPGALEAAAAVAAAEEGGEDGADRVPDDSLESHTRRIVMRPKRLMLAALAMLALVAAGCTSYYRIRDTTSGRTYYTEDYKRRNGTVVFTDTKSGSEITLPSSEISEITSEEYKKNTTK